MALRNQVYRRISNLISRDPIFPTHRVVLPAEAARIRANGATIVTAFIARQITQIKEGGYAVLRSKAKAATRMAMELPGLMVAIPLVVVVRLVRPLILLRFGIIKASRIGHFAGNTELYLCERDAGINRPAGRHLDFFYLQRPISNQQLAKMWRRHLWIVPSMLLEPVVRVNRLISGGARHEVGNNTQEDRDVHNLIDKTAPHLAFSEEEEGRGESGLRAMGIAPGAPFVCLIVRDSAYLGSHMRGSWDYHDYRDSEIENYVLAAEELARRGYHVVRMGAKVRKPMPTDNPKVFDYAMSGARTDFMDIYLGAKCAFCVSSNTGFDYVPTIFRRPVVYVNMAPLGYISTFRARDITIVKHHISVCSGRELRLQEIVDKDAAFFIRECDYENKNVRMIENAPEEIRDAVVEMAERIEGTWMAGPNDEYLQERFWAIVPVAAACNGTPLHGEIRARIGAAFLRNSGTWLD